MKNIYFIILSTIIILYMLYSIRKNTLSIKTSFVWVVLSLIMLLLSIFPKSIDYVAVKLGITYPPTLLLTLCIVLLLVQNFNSSKKIYDLQEKLNYLEQETTLLRDEKNEKK